MSAVVVAILRLCIIYLDLIAIADCNPWVIAKVRKAHEHPELSSLLDAFQSSLRIKSRNLFLEYHKSPIPPSETIVP